MWFSVLHDTEQSSHLTDGLAFARWWFGIITGHGGVLLAVYVYVKVLKCSGMVARQSCIARLAQGVLYLLMIFTFYPNLLWLIVYLPLILLGGNGTPWGRRVAEVCALTQVIIVVVIMAYRTSKALASKRQIIANPGVSAAPSTDLTLSDYAPTKNRV